jgi:hypothetical protein
MMAANEAGWRAWVRPDSREISGRHGEGFAAALATF